MLVDVHAHLDHAHYKDKLDVIIARAKKIGMSHVLTSGVNPVSNKNALELSRKYDIVYFSAGLYPIDLLGNVDVESMPRQIDPIDMDEQFKFIQDHKDEVLAIGEVGLDGKFCADQLPKQKENFEKILRFVEKINKPIVLHSRKAESSVIDLLESSSLKKVNLHCFMGNKKLIKRACDLGYHFSIPPLIVKLHHFQMLVDLVPLNQLLTETDAPWLSPFPNQKSEPAFVVESLKKIAEIKKITTEEVTKNIFMNFQKLFLQQ
tara:strand:+ start:71048 stop:71833 length:786 start_codon:yes stop_codon:yes gene_type:complete